MPNPPRFDNTYNLGHVLQLAGIGIQGLVVLGALMGFWIGLSGRLTTVELRMEAIVKLTEQLTATRDLTNQNAFGIRQSEVVMREMSETMKAVLQQLTVVREDIAALKARN